MRRVRAGVLMLTMMTAVTGTACSRGVDVETGAYDILDFVAIADVGTVINPRSLRGQTFGGVMLGIGHAIGQKWVYDQHYGVPLAVRFHHNKPPTILDAPRHVDIDALNIPDPETPVGARGIGEPPVGAGYGAILNAIADAIGDDKFQRSPVTADIILTSLEARKGAWVPEWLELNADQSSGRVLNIPTRQSIAVPVNEQLIVELYSK